ncbi:hypothetical protein ScPMuIL_009209 [Solemya velum]
MADEDLDLETLTAFLQESDAENEDDGQAGDEATCKSSSNISKHDGECDLDELTAFLEASDDDDDDNDKESNVPGSHGITGVDEIRSEKSCEKEADTSVNKALEEELLKMKERMKFLEEQLMSQKKSPPTISSPQESKPKFRETEESLFFPETDKKSKPQVLKKKVKATEKNDKVVDKKDRKELERSLFGDSDGDSDWEQLGEDSKTELSKEGKELHSLLKKGPKQREAHTPKFDSTYTSPQTCEYTSPQTSEYTSLQTRRKSSDQSAAKKEFIPEVKKTETQNSRTDPFSGIRIINPKVSSLDLKLKMEDRKMIKLSHLASKVNTTALQSNWVTIGVVIHKTEPRQSSSGKTFCIWKLTDLQDCDKVVSFFLFGNVYKQHWKNDVGTVIGLLNPSLMDAAEKKQSDLAFTLSHPQQLLILGHSCDLGKCAGRTKAGNSCTNVINRQQGEYCSYHVQAAYKKSSSKRAELQTSYTGKAPKAFERQNKLLKGNNSLFFYGGETFNNTKTVCQKNKDAVTVKKLKHQLSTKGKEKITTMSIHELDPEDEKNWKNYRRRKIKLS